MNFEFERIAKRSPCVEKSHEVADSVKETAHAVSVKAQELEKTAEEKLIVAEKKGKGNVLSLTPTDSTMLFQAKKNLEKPSNG